MEPILEVKNLTKTFVKEGQSDFTALSNVSFQLYPGETLGIVGESGSGKSTLARAVSRLIPVTDGRIIMKGQDMTRVKGKGLRSFYKEMQMVFQAPVTSFDPRKTLGHGISESLRNHGVSRAEAAKRAAELLVQCGLPAEYAGRYPHEVSGGQCQRAAIARALAMEPEILICDEATSALDVTVQQQVMELLKSLRKEKNLSYIFICHNLGLVQSFCDRLLVMYDGKIVEEGTPEEVILRPKSEYAKQLVEAAF